LLGKLGGITNVMMLLFGFILFEWSEHSFVLKAAKKLFIARTRDEHLFIPDPRVNIEVKAKTKKVQKELDLHRVIKLRFRDRLCLFISLRMGSCFPNICWKKKNREKFQKLYTLTT
jgi:hypothetical protein